MPAANWALAAAARAIGRMTTAIKCRQGAL